MHATHQRTLKNQVETRGVGLHSGAQVRLRLRPAAAGTGIRFVRTDLSAPVELPATVANIVDTRFATTLGTRVGGEMVKVGTVEHLLSAMAGLGVDNAYVDVDGPEVPVLDGSAAPLVFMIKGAGIRIQKAYKRFLVVRRPIEVREGEGFARIAPSRSFKVSCSIDFEHPLIGRQSLDFEFSDRAYHREISKARTFGFLNEIEALKAAGLARGGSLDNAIVVDRFSILNSGGLRFPDEFVRHKVLDSIGDLALLGMPVIGHLKTHRPGHALNHRLTETLLASPSAFEILEVREEAELGRLGLRLPTLAFGADAL